MSEQIPTGSYACALVTDADGFVRFPIVSGNNGELSIEVRLYLFAKGVEQPFTETMKLECIDAEQAPRGNTDTTPYEFMALALKALGADPASIDDAVINGLASNDGYMIFPGTPRAATADVSYKAGNKGGSFMNMKIMPLREVTDDARSKAIEAARARKARNAPTPSPFTPPPGRGAVVAPPGAKPNPFAPRAAG